MFYAAAHPVPKKNMLYVLQPDLPNLTAAWVPGILKPVKGVSDKFLKVRLASWNQKGVCCFASL